jgi:hypothetical protein
MLRAILLGTLACCVGVLAFASDSGQAQESKAAPEAAASPPPAESPLSRIRKGMTEGEVTEILGPPTSSTSYRTGKGKIPFYFGSDMRRQLWKYREQGRVLFARGRWRPYRVIRVEYDPKEPGGWGGPSDGVVTPPVPPPPRAPRPRRPPRPF